MTEKQWKEMTTEEKFRAVCDDLQTINQISGRAHKRLDALQNAISEIFERLEQLESGAKEQTKAS